VGACPRVNLRELQAIRQSLQLTAASPLWWTSASDGQMQASADDAAEEPPSAVYASLRGCSRSLRGVDPRKGAATQRQALQRGIVWVHFWPRGRMPMVETRKATEKSAGRGHRLHDLRSMRLPVPTVQSCKELKEGCDLAIIEGVREDRAGFRGGSKGARRFAPGPYGGALPRTPEQLFFLTGSQGDFSPSCRFAGCNVPYKSRGGAVQEPLPALYVVAFCKLAVRPSQACGFCFDRSRLTYVCWSGQVSIAKLHFGI